MTFADLQPRVQRGPGRKGATRSRTHASGPSVRPRRSRADRAFTLVEIIVVLVILGVMAGLVLPHALNTGRRQVEVEARAAQHLLSIAAERDSLSVEPQAIEYDDTLSELRLLVRRSGSAATVSRGTTADAWHADPLLLPVVFTGGQLVQAWADGRPLPRNQWRVVLSQDQSRPSIVLQIEPRTGRAGSASPDKVGAWQVALPAEASAASRAPVTSGQGFSAAINSRSIDLDASGKGEKPW